MSCELSYFSDSHCGDWLQLRLLVSIQTRANGLTASHQDCVVFFGRCLLPGHSQKQTRSSPATTTATTTTATTTAAQAAQAAVAKPDLLFHTTTTTTIHPSSARFFSRFLSRVPSPSPAPAPRKMYRRSLTVATAAVFRAPAAQVTRRVMSNQAATSALLYKATHPRRQLPKHAEAMPVIPSVEEAVGNLLYNSVSLASATGSKDAAKTVKKKCILDVLAQDESGVLSRVTGVLAARGFSIDSLVASKTEVPGLSRMTICLTGEPVYLEQVKRQIEDLVPIWAVLEYNPSTILERELLLVKVSICGAEYAASKLKGNAGQTDSNAPTASADAAPLTSIATDDTAQHTLLDAHAHLQALKSLAQLFDAKVVDVSHDSCTIELTANSRRIDAFLSLTRPFGVLEAVRSGIVAIPRAIVESVYDQQVKQQNADVADDGAAVDATQLPPG
ncbi:acetolactate synthase [Ramicandelaber brevisporus]|nr:acetolactate synthase [Ramicandelaber brevisporus]